MIRVPRRWPVIGAAALLPIGAAWPMWTARVWTVALAVLGVAAVRASRRGLRPAGIVLLAGVGYAIAAGLRFVPRAPLIEILTWSLSIAAAVAIVDGALRRQARQKRAR